MSCKAPRYLPYIQSHITPIRKWCYHFRNLSSLPIHNAHSDDCAFDKIFYNTITISFSKNSVKRISTRSSNHHTRSLGTYSSNSHCLFNLDSRRCLNCNTTDPLLHPLRNLQIIFLQKKEMTISAHSFFLQFQVLDIFHTSLAEIGHSDVIILCMVA